MNFMPPRYGELVPLICLKCHKHFVGPNPTGDRSFEDLFKKRKKAKCPECGSSRVVRNPWVLFKKIVYLVIFAFLIYCIND